MAIWQDLVDDHGFAARYASVKRYVAKLKTTATPEAIVFGRVHVLRVPQAFAINRSR